MPTAASQQGEGDVHGEGGAGAGAGGGMTAGGVDDRRPVKPNKRFPPGHGVGVSNEPELYKPADDIIICFDGTWCGEATGTTGNIKIIADSLAEESPDGGPLASPPLVGKKDDYGTDVYERRFTRTVEGDDGMERREVYVRYFEGPGLEGTFADYVGNAALALDIDDHCVRAYLAIVRRYKPGSRVWLFGFSRGAFVVRCVAEMIHRCGILDLSPEGKKLNTMDEMEVFDMCNRVYSAYCNSTRQPRGEACNKFRTRFSHEMENGKPPVRFMGLLDTVGALGVPQITAGQHLQYEYLDTNVSEVVQTVCQALAAHDRLGPFTPCFVSRREDLDASYTAEEVWFPGSHYDIGRQRFIFGRKSANLMEKLVREALERTDCLTINYTPSLSDPPALYLLARARKASDGFFLHRPGREYVDMYKKDPEPPQVKQPPHWTQWWVRLKGLVQWQPETIDAYDSLYARWKASNLPFHVVLSFISLLVTRQLLVDREIPESCRKAPTPTYFYCPDYDGLHDGGLNFIHRPDSPDPKHPVEYKSRSFQSFQLVGKGSIEYVGGDSFEANFKPEARQ